MDIPAGEYIRSLIGQSHPGVRGAHLMVREDQIGSASLHVEGDAQVVRGDSRAFHMPAGSSRAEPRFPGRLAWPLGSPDPPGERILLSRPVGVATALGRQ